MWLVISDTHIGDKHANINLQKLYSLLEEFSTYNYDLVLNGDIFDFAKHLEFDERHRTFLKIIQKYKKIIYIEGNHDYFLTGLADVIPNILFKKELLLFFGNKIVKITHGHQTDIGVVWFPRITRCLTRLNAWFYNITGIDLQHRIRQIKWVKRLFTDKQAKKLMRREKVADILIAGHIHLPGVHYEYGIEYYNTGDWVEKDHCHYLTIDEDSNIKLIKV